MERLIFVRGDGRRLKRMTVYLPVELERPLLVYSARRLITCSEAVALLVRKATEEELLEIAGRGKEALEAPETQSAEPAESTSRPRARRKRK